GTGDLPSRIPCDHRRRTRGGRADPHADLPHHRRPDPAALAPVVSAKPGNAGTKKFA
nr:hypothetical protein [Tanacetum cinerariifolium]